jgi:hypothetical protein
MTFSAVTSPFSTGPLTSRLPALATELPLLKFNVSMWWQDPGKELLNVVRSVYLDLVYRPQSARP